MPDPPFPPSLWQWTMDTQVPRTRHEGWSATRSAPRLKSTATEVAACGEGEVLEGVVADLAQKDARPMLQPRQVTRAA